MIWLIIFVFICIACPFVPFALKNFYNICVNGATDIFYYFKHKEYNRCNWYGKVYMFTAYRNRVFGSGKTLSGSMLIRSIYNQYNGLPVWDKEEQKFVEQHINIISNIDLKDVPYKKFVSSEQLKNIEQAENDVTIVFFDEAGQIWNSREFKKNIPHDLLKSLLQCRHIKLGMICTSQRYKFVDALLRQITGTLVCVRKWWRILKFYEYDPVNFESCDNIDMLKPLKVSYRFVFNKDYAAYDTSEIVEDLKNADMLTDAEILAAQGIQQPDIDFATGIKLRFRKRKR